MTVQSKSERPTILFISFLTGFTALLYEISWQKYLTNIMGSDSRGTTLTLAVFLLGLGIGYYLFGKLSLHKGSRSLIRTYGVMEGLIGVWGLLFLLAYHFLSPSIGILPLEQPIGILYDLLLVVIAIGPATILMGATLPLLTQCFCGVRHEDNTFHATLYAVNTAGAGIGAASGGLLFLPLLGLFPTSLLAVFLNLLVGAYVYLKYRNEEQSADPHQEKLADKEKENLSLFKHALPHTLVAFLIGFIGLTLQTLILRIAGISIGPSETNFSLIVAVYIFLTAFGAWYFIKRRELTLPSLFSLMLLGLLLLYIFVPYAPYLLYLLRVQFESTLSGFYLYTAALFLTFMILLALPITALGSILPRLVLATKTTKTIGEAVGIIYGANTLGSVLGAFLGGYTLYAYTDLPEIYWLLILLTLLSSEIVALRITRPTHKFLRVIPLVFAVLCFAAPGWSSHYLQFGIFRERSVSKETYQGRAAVYDSLLKGSEVKYHNDSTETSVTIAEFEEEDKPYGDSFSRSIILSGKSDGNTAGDRRTMRLLGHLPALLTSGEGRAAIVGFGTGMTAGSVLLYPSVSQVDIIEIEPSTDDFAPLFDFANGGVSKNKKVNWIFKDAYRYLGATESRYRFIVSQPSNPWMAGIERLYTHEFYQLVKEKLLPDGVYVHWLPLHDLSAESIILILHTLHEVFPEVRIFKNGFDVILLGSNQPLKEAALASLSSQFTLPRVKEDLDEIQIPSIQYLLGLEQWISPELYDKGSIHTLLRPRLSTLARRDFFLNKTAQLQLALTPPSDWYLNRIYAQNSLLRIWLTSSHEPLEVKNLLAAGCGGIKIQLIEPNWRYLRSVCRDAAIAAFLMKDVQPPAHIGGEIAWLKEFYSESGTSPMADKKSEDVRKDIALFMQFDSPLVKLSEKKLLWRASPCFRDNSEANLMCRYELIHALISTARFDEATRQLKTLERDARGIFSPTKVNQLTAMLKRTGPRVETK